MQTVIRTSRQAPLFIPVENRKEALLGICQDENTGKAFILLEHIPFREQRAILTIKYKLDDKFDPVFRQGGTPEWEEHVVYSEYMWCDENTPPNDVFTFVLSKGEHKTSHPQYVDSLEGACAAFFGDPHFFYTTPEKLRTARNSEPKNPAVKKKR
jgi:hypothetical protein